MSAVTVLGLGNLGRALAGQFVAAGHETTVWSRTQRDVPGATAIAGPGQAAELVVVAVLDYPAATAVLADLPPAGRTVVNLTSGTPSPARDLAATVRAGGGEYLTGAVYAVPQTIGTSDASIIYSGDADAYDRHRPVLDLLGAGRYLGADPGLAPAYDLAILAGMYGMLGGFLHATAMAAAAGITATDLTPLLSSWLTGALPALPEFAREIDARDYRTEMSNLDINNTGLTTIIEASEAQGVSAAFLEPLRALVSEQAANFPKESLSRVFESLRVERPA